MRASRGTRRRRAAAVAIGAIILLWSAIPAAALTPVKVIGGEGQQYWPSSNGTYLAWTSVVNDHSNVYVKELPSGTPDRVNPRGTSAAYGSFVGTSNVLVYEEWSRAARGDVFFYDVSTGITTRAPDAVSRPGTWDYAPMASDHYISFARNKWSADGRLLSHTLLLYDRLTGVTKTLDDRRHGRLRPDVRGPDLRAVVDVREEERDPVQDPLLDRGRRQGSPAEHTGSRPVRRLHERGAPVTCTSFGHEPMSAEGRSRSVVGTWARPTRRCSRSCRTASTPTL